MPSHQNLPPIDFSLPSPTPARVSDADRRLEKHRREINNAVMDLPNLPYVADWFANINEDASNGVDFDVPIDSDALSPDGFDLSGFFDGVFDLGADAVDGIGDVFSNLADFFFNFN
jgi:hypothetical protein